MHLPFDAGNWPLKIQIYYVSGTNDPNVPKIEQTDYHIANEPESKRFDISIPGGGHDRLGMVFPDCFENVWQAIYDGSDNAIHHALKSCIIKPTLKIDNAASK